ncbi:MAG: hypothetical protein DI528_21550 [Shinella sp.]|nr:MAG: hypothetical protein DI528_21550 [Shinella sp.]
MSYQLEDDPSKYHQGAILSDTQGIHAMRFEGVRHYHAGPGERLHDVTAHMLTVTLASKNEHERSLALAQSHD